MRIASVYYSMLHVLANNFFPLRHRRIFCLFCSIPFFLKILSQSNQFHEDAQTMWNAAGELNRSIIWRAETPTSISHAMFSIQRARVLDYRCSLLDLLLYTRATEELRKRRLFPNSGRYFSRFASIASASCNIYCTVNVARTMNVHEKTPLIKKTRMCFISSEFEEMRFVRYARSFHMAS